MMLVNKKFRKGAASFYIVAFSTLILLIVAMSFAAVIISELERTSNEDLSQSAYDSAMAGVEDSKLAFYNYQNCIANGATASDAPSTTLDCDAIMYYMENPLGQDCDMVGHILGRVGVLESGEVLIEDSSTGSNNMQQAYTCTKLQTVLKDYRSTLSSSTQLKVVKVKFDGVPADKISKLKISWYSETGTDYAYTNFMSEKVVFPQIGSQKKAVPPTISVAMLQTAEEFSLSDFDMTKGDKTDRGMLYLVPIGGGDEKKSKELAGKSKDGNYIGAYNGTNNVIAKSGFLKSNDKKTTNLPYGVYCSLAGGDSEFACSATIDLPKPIGGTRSDDTFMFVVGLPYGTPETDFAMEFFCDDECATDKLLTTNEEGEKEVVEQKTNQVSLSGVQIKVDSTGRANDLYRRIETRLEGGGGGDGSYLSLMGPLELLGQDNSADLLKKVYAVKKEWNF